MQYYIVRVNSNRPYDLDSNPVTVKEYFTAAQRDYLPAIYLTNPEQACSGIFPILLQTMTTLFSHPLASLSQKTSAYPRYSAYVAYLNTKNT